MVSTDLTYEKSLTPSGMVGEFELCFRREYEGVARTSGLAVGDGDLGREIAQEAFTRLYERWDQIRSPEHARRFAYRVAFNLTRSYLRQNRRTKSQDGIETTSTTGKDPSDAVADRIVILQVVVALSPRQRACLLLVDFAGFEAREAAKTLRIRPATVNVHLYRARRAVRSALGSIEERG